MRTWLKDTRENLGLTMKDAAQRLDITESYYSRIERGDRQKNLDGDLAFRMSKAFDISISDIFKNEYGEGSA